MSQGRAEGMARGGRAGSGCDRRPSRRKPGTWAASGHDRALVRSTRDRARQAPKTAVSGEPRSARVQHAALSPLFPCRGPLREGAGAPTAGVRALQAADRGPGRRTHFRGENAATRPPHQPQCRAMVGKCWRSLGRRQGALQMRVADSKYSCVVDFINYFSMWPPKTRDHERKTSIYKIKTTVRPKLCKAFSAQRARRPPAQAHSRIHRQPQALLQARAGVFGSTFERRLAERPLAGLALALVAAHRARPRYCSLLGAVARGEARMLRVAAP